MSTDPRLSATALPPMACSSCGDVFTPRYLKALKKWAKVCPKCAVLSMARLMEDEDPGMTIKEISDGEQVGAWLRSFAGQSNSEVSPPKSVRNTPTP